MISVGENHKFYEYLQGNEHEVLEDLGNRVRIEYGGYSFTVFKKHVAQNNVEFDFLMATPHH